MSSITFVPNSLREAGSQLRLALSIPLTSLTKTQFVRAWSSVAYLFPGLHPDGYECADSGWSRVLRRFAAEAWRRAEACELADDELHPADAQWAGLYDRMFLHTAEETARRQSLTTAS